MLDSFLNFFISRKEVGKSKVSLKNPFALTCEKITRTPRVFTTSQITSAIENTLLVSDEEKNVPELTTKIAEYILKDFFLYMHQTGLYNRQFKFWRTLGNIRHVSVFKLEKRFFKEEEPGCYLIDFFIDEKAPCIKAIIQENITNAYKDFKSYLSWIMHFSNLSRLKGVIYFVDHDPEAEFIKEINHLTSAFDSISKYESIINDTLDVRLNLVSYKKEDDQFSFKHVYPELRSDKYEELRATNERN